MEKEFRLRQVIYQTAGLAEPAAPGHGRRRQSAAQLSRPPTAAIIEWDLGHILTPFARASPLAALEFCCWFFWYSDVVVCITLSRSACPPYCWFWQNDCGRCASTPSLQETRWTNKCQTTMEPTHGSWENWWIWREKNERADRLNSGMCGSLFERDALRRETL